MSRILLLCAELGGVGGVERLIATLAPLLNEEHEVHVASFDPAGTKPDVPLTVPFHPIGESFSPSLMTRPKTYLTQVRQLRRLERGLGIDVTISNLWRADLISALVGGRPRRVALAHINVVGNPTNRLMMRLRPLVAMVYRRFDRVVTVSGALARELSALYRLDPAKIRTIWNATTPPEAMAISPGYKRIAWCGRMVSEKNLPALVAAFARVRTQHPDARLDLVGDGPERAAVEAAAAERDLAVGDEASGSPIVVHGRLADPAKVMAGATILALPSRAEGLPLVLIESLALGVPIFAADCASGGVHEAMAARSPHDPARGLDEEVACGLLLPVPNDDAGILRWSKALEAVFSNDAKLLYWRQGARLRACDFAPEAMLVKWTQLLKELQP